MNLKKFISGISALTIAASAFAGLAVTASAVVTDIASDDFESIATSEGAKIANSGTLSSGNITWTTGSKTTGYLKKHGSSSIYPRIVQALASGNSKANELTDIAALSDGDDYYLYFWCGNANTTSTFNAVASGINSGDVTISFDMILPSITISASNRASTNRGNYTQPITVKDNAGNVVTTLSYNGTALTIGSGTGADTIATVPNNWMDVEIAYDDSTNTVTTKVVADGTTYTGTNSFELADGNTINTIDDTTANPGKSEFNWANVGFDNVKFTQDISDTLHNVSFTSAPNASLVFSQNGAEVGSVTADATGAASIYIEDGTYDIAVSAPNYASNTFEGIAISEGVASQATLTLTQLPTVTYDMSDLPSGVTYSGSASVIVGQDYIPASAPTVSDTANAIGGYAFLGWATSADGTSFVTPTSIAVNADTTYYPVFSEQITRSVRYYATQDSYINRTTNPNEVYTNTEVIPLSPYNSYGATLRNAFINVESINTKNAVAATVNVYVPNADYSSNGGRRYTINVYSTKRSDWTANNLTSNWSTETGGANNQLTSIIVDTTKNGDGFTPRYFSGKLTSKLNELNNLYLTQTATAATVNTSSIEGGNPAYVEVFYTDYAVTVDPDIENGTVTSDVTSAKAGETVTLTVTPDTNYEIGTVSVNGTPITPDNGVYSFTMPAEAVTVSATFKSTVVEPSVSITEVDSKAITYDNAPYTAAKLLVNVVGSVSGINVTYNAANKTMKATDMTAITNGTIVLGAIVADNVTVDLNTFSVDVATAE